MVNIYGLTGMGTSEINTLENHLSNAMYAQIVFLMSLNNIESIDFEKMSDNFLCKPNIIDRYDRKLMGLKLNHETNELSFIINDLEKGEVVEKPYEHMFYFYEELKTILYAVENVTNRRCRKEFIEKGIIKKSK